MVISVDGGLRGIEGEMSVDVYECMWVKGEVCGVFFVWIVGRRDGKFYWDYQVEGCRSAQGGICVWSDFHGHLPRCSLACFYRI